MEICEICQANPAVLHITQINGNDMVIHHYCEVCAEERGFSAPSEEPGKIRKNQINLETENNTLEEFQEEVSLYCPRCTTREEEIVANKKVGCTTCYEVFEEIISTRLYHYKGNHLYCGKKYRAAESRYFQTEVDYLRLELHSAVTQQKFELASVLRDRIRDLEYHQVVQND